MGVSRLFPTALNPYLFIFIVFDLDLYKPFIFPRHLSYFVIYFNLLINKGATKPFIPARLPTKLFI